MVKGRLCGTSGVFKRSLIEKMGQQDREEKECKIKKCVGHRRRSKSKEWLDGWPEQMEGSPELPVRVKKKPTKNSYGLLSI